VEVGAARADRLEAAHVEEAEPSLPPVEARWVLVITLHATLTARMLRVPRQALQPCQEAYNDVHVGYCCVIMQAVAMSDRKDKCKRCNVQLCLRQAVAATSQYASLCHAL